MADVGDKSEGEVDQMMKMARLSEDSGKLFNRSSLRNWADVSRINYIPSEMTRPKSMTVAGGSLRGHIGLSSKGFFSSHGFMPYKLSEDSLLEELIPVNRTKLMNEGQLWGCFYNFPELYSDAYSPTLRILQPDDIAELVDGVLTRDMIATCLTYPKRTPILGDFVYIKLSLSGKAFSFFPELYSDAYSPTLRILQPDDIAELVDGVLTRDMIATCLTYPKRTPILDDFVYIKLSLSGKHLLNIDVLQHYRYLVYLDLSSNLLTDLSVLSYLLYLQFISVNFNRLNTVLDYNTPQWFLTEVHYKYNSVKRIRDLDMFWSITILDLSHNNIKYISGLQNLRYLRHLDLSFNHIERLENLNHLRLLWLDLSYNNILTFEFNANAGPWTMLDLQYLNLNENSLKSLQMFSGCTRLRELHMRNNRVGLLLELAVYMRQCRRLRVLDMRANAICSAPGYHDVVFDIFPQLTSLDAIEVDPEVQRSSLQNSLPDVRTFASRRLLRMLYVEQLRRARVSPHVPPADTREVPLVVLVGVEGSGKGTLARRLATEYSSKIQLALQHTTSDFHYPNHYKEISRDKFDEMVLAGEFLTYSEMDGESYGLSREEAFICDGKVRLCTMDLVAALMLKQRGRRPYLILASFSDKQVVSRIQKERREARNEAARNRYSMTSPPRERSTLQVMLSGRILITGILNEILVTLPEEKDKSEFMIDSECSLFMDSEARKAGQDYTRAAHLLNLITSSTSSLERLCQSSKERGSEQDASMYSLYKESQNDVDLGPGSSVRTDRSKHIPPRNSVKEPQQASKKNETDPTKNYDFSRYTSSTWKGIPQEETQRSTKSSKSVTFTSQSQDAEGDGVEGYDQELDDDHRETAGKSVSTKLMPCPSWPAQDGYDDLDLWLAFLVNTGLLQASDVEAQSAEYGYSTRLSIRMDEPSSIIRQLGYYVKTPHETNTTNLRDEYESIHRKLPSIFWDTITMDDPDAAFLKAKRIIKDIVQRQSQFQPMFDIDFANLKNYPTVEKRLNDIRREIAPHNVFY